MHIVQSALLIAALPFALQAQESPSLPEVQAIGYGEVKVTPDRAIVFIGVETEGSSPAIAGGQNARLTAGVIAAVRRFGVPDSAIVTAGYTIRPHTRPADNRRDVIRNFVAFNSVRVTLRQIDRLGALMDTVLAAGATNISGISLESPEQPAARRRALALAVANARAEATAIAEALGGRLGSPVHFTTHPEPPRRGYGGGGGMGYGLQMSALRVGPETPILTPDELTVTATVNGRWRLETR